MSGTEYVIDQLGMALRASHELIEQQKQQIDRLAKALEQAPATTPEPPDLIAR